MLTLRPKINACFFSWNNTISNLS